MTRMMGHSQPFGFWETATGQFSLTATSVRLKRALTNCDAKWPHEISVNFIFLNVYSRLSYLLIDARLKWCTTPPLKLPIKAFNIRHKHTRTYHYKRWVLSQARSFIDLRKMPESTLTVVAQWDCKVNINQRERWLIDPLLPNSPSRLSLIVPSFYAPPSLSLQPPQACPDHVVSLRMLSDRIKIQISNHIHLKSDSNVTFFNLSLPVTTHKM